MNTIEQRRVRDFARIAAISTAMGFGVLAGALYSIQRGASGVTFQISSGAVIVTLFGALAGWIYWRQLSKLIFAAEEAPPATRYKNIRKFVLCNIGVGVAMLLAFAYPLRFVEPERKEELVTGLGAAFWALALVAVALFKVKKFLDRDEQRARQTGQH